MFYPEKKPKIPSEFVLFGHKYTVLLQKDLFEKEDCYGDADEDLKRIRIQDVGKIKRIHEEDGKKIEVEIEITENTVLETFFHEVTHIIYDAIGDTDLSSNETLVNITGKAWLEIYLSTVYEKTSE